MSFGYDIGCDTCMKSEACKDDKRRVRFFRDCIGYEPQRVKDAIDEMLSNANLAPCFDLTKLKQYLKEQSDLSDSSLTAANGMFERIIKMA